MAPWLKRELWAIRFYLFNVLLVLNFLLWGITFLGWIFND